MRADSELSSSFCWLEKIACRSLSGDWSRQKEELTAGMAGYAQVLDKNIPAIILPFTFSRSFDLTNYEIVPICYA